MSHPIYDAIEAKLTADKSDGSLYDDVKGRIHEGQLPWDSDHPAIRYALISDPMNGRFQNDAASAEVQFDVYGDRNPSMAEVYSINKKLRDLLHKKSLSITGFAGGQAWCLDRGQPIAEPDVNRIMSRYRIWANES